MTYSCYSTRNLKKLCYVHRKKLQLLNSENNGTIYLFKSIITLFPVVCCHRWQGCVYVHELKLEKAGQMFSTVLILCMQKSPQNVLVSAFSDKLVLYLLHNTITLGSRGYFILLISRTGLWSQGITL